jgi:hypothetical protein
MAPQKQKVAMARVADGKELISVPTGDESAEERVRALFSGSMSKDMYQVSFEFCYFKVPVLLKVNSAFLYAFFYSFPYFYMSKP